MGDQKSTQAPVASKAPAKVPSKPSPAVKAPEHQAGPMSGVSAAKAPAGGDMPGPRKVQRRRRPDTGADTGPATAPAAQGVDKDRVATAPKPPTVSSPSDPAEKHAEQVARKVAAGESQRVTPAGGGDQTHRVMAPTSSAPVPAAPAEKTGEAGASSPAKEVHPATDLARAIQAPSGGEPIPQPTRGILEQRLGEDLGHVRIHRGPEADRLSRDISAHAFTKGHDIWLASDTSPYDVELMAHEVTHVLQGIPGTLHRIESKGGKKGKAAAKDAPPPKPDPNVVVDDAKVKVTHLAAPKGVMNFRGERPTLEFQNRPTVPPFKDAFHNKEKLTWHSSKQRTDERAQAGGDQRDFWIAGNKEASAAAVKAKLYDGVDGFKQFRGPADGDSQYRYLGTAGQVGEAIVVPTWQAKDRDYSRFQVDHKQEWQLGGAYKDVKNLWLLQAKINQASGTYVQNVIDQQVKAFVQAVAPHVRHQAQFELGRVHPDTNWLVTWVVPSTPEETKVSWNGPEFDEASMVWYPAGGDHQDQAIGSDRHVKALVPETGALSDNPNELMILPGLAGGQVKRLKRQNKKKPSQTPQSGDSDWDLGDLSSQRSAEGSTKAAKAVRRRTWRLNRFTWLKPGQPAPVSGDQTSGKAADGEKVGEFTGTAFKSDGDDSTAKLMVSKELVVPLWGRKGIAWGGYYSREAVSDLRQKLDFKPFSPITFPELDFDLVDGLSGRGKIDPPSLEILKKADIGVILGGDLGLGLEATITGGQLALPGPLQVTGGELTLGVGTGGIIVGGDLYFEIKNLAQGHIGAAASVKSNGGASFALEGELDFDSKMFDKAHLGVSYIGQQWKVSGELAVTTPGKIKGIKSAHAKIDITAGDVKADGTFEPDIKGIESGHLGLHYNQTTGPEITGDITLGKDFPGIRSGRISATVAKPPGAEKWSLDATGTAEPDIPGVQSQINVAYKDGVFDANLTAAYSKGLMSGQLMFGATNRPVSADGKPGDAPADPAAAKIIAYGGGQMTVKLTPWLAGTVGVKILPNGEIELMGKVALPGTLDIFAQKKLQKELFKIGLDIPIVGIAVAGQRIGIFATIQGGADIEASIGPGQLRQLALEVHYNPAHEDQTTITGGAQVHVPAMAGLRLFVRGALGAGIPVVSAEAGLEISGELGIQGEATAAVTINWSPTQGLDLAATASVQAEPVFRFGIAGYVLVEADLWVTTIELYSKRWQLADVQLGSGLKLGMTLPVHYHEGQPFDVSVADVQFDVPKIEPKQILTDLIERIA